MEIMMNEFLWLEVDSEGVGMMELPILEVAYETVYNAQREEGRNG